MKIILHVASRYLKPGLFCLAALVLQACQPTDVSIAINKTSGSTIAGEALALQQALVIPPGRARVYFQHGAQVRLSAIDKYQAWCEFEIKTLAENPQTIHADRFTIQKQVNERSGLLDGAGFGSMSNALEEFATVLYLKSASQPDVFRLTCLRRRGSRMQTYLSPGDMQSALGDIIILNIK